MTIRALTLAAAFMLSACTTSSTEPRTDPAPAAFETGNEVTLVQVIEPSAAMLRAALSGDPSVMGDALAATSSCQAASSCPAAYGSCSGWSAPSQCDFTCGPSTCPCIDIPPEGVGDNCDPNRLIGRTTYNSYRVCFNATHQACTEWKQTLSFFCGC
jgi:hypothetical protein